MSLTLARCHRGHYPGPMTAHDDNSRGSEVPDDAVADATRCIRRTACCVR